MAGLMEKNEIHFGTDGWRAVIAREFTFENVSRVALSISDYLISKNIARKPVVVGYDHRFLGEQFARLVADVFSARGIEVLLCLAPAPTPAVAYAVLARKAAGAVMLTASHNPPEYQGIKFIPDYAGPAFPAITAAIEKNLASQKKNLEIKPDSQKISNFDPRPEYFRQLRQLLDFKCLQSRKFRIVYDPMFGVGFGYLDELLKEAGQRVIIIHGSKDPLFGGVLPEPKKSTLTDLMKEVKKSGAVLGLATDGDADRFGVVDEKEHFVSPEAVGALLFNYLVTVKKIKGAAVKTVAMTHTMDKIANRYKVKLYTTPVGFKYLAQIMLREPVIIGCEQSSGLSIRGHIPEKDGIMAALLILEMLTHYRKPLSRILKDLMAEFGPFYNDSFNLELKKENQGELIEQLRQYPPRKLAGSAFKKIVTIDGVKIIYENCWFLVRPSGTEPLVRLYFEADSPGVLKKAAQEVTALVKKISY
jgi:phosphomannomutase